MERDTDCRRRETECDRPYPALGKRRINLRNRHVYRRPPHRTVAASWSYHRDKKIYLSSPEERKTLKKEHEEGYKLQAIRVEMRDRYTLQWERGGNTARHAVLTATDKRRTVPERPTRHTELFRTCLPDRTALSHIPQPRRTRLSLCKQL
jgi:hypothetical protein